MGYEFLILILTQSVVSLCADFFPRIKFDHRRIGEQCVNQASERFVSFTSISSQGFEPMKSFIYRLSSISPNQQCCSRRTSPRTRWEKEFSTRQLLSLKSECFDMIAVAPLTMKTQIENLPEFWNFSSLVPSRIKVLIVSFKGQSVFTVFCELFLSSISSRPNSSDLSLNLNSG